MYYIMINRLLPWKLKFLVCFKFLKCMLQSRFGNKYSEPADRRLQDDSACVLRKACLRSCLGIVPVFLT